MTSFSQGTAVLNGLENVVSKLPQRGLGRSKPETNFGTFELENRIRYKTIFGVFNTLNFTNAKKTRSTTSYRADRRCD